MYCMKCQNDLLDCTCDDLEERLASLKNSPKIIYKKCRKCDRHYARCKCEEPDWTTSRDGVEMSDVQSDLWEGILRFYVQPLQGDRR